jgi:chitinase
LGTNTNRPEDRANYTLLLQEIRNQLDSFEAADGQDYLLTIAASANPDYIANLELPQLAGVLDWINVMTYDYHGGWEMQTGLQSPLAMAPGDPFTDAAVLNVEYALQSFLWGGVPADQLTLGIPFYGRGWSGVGVTNDGLFQPATGVPVGTWEAGNFDYHDVIDNWASPATVHWEPTAQVPWVYDAAQQVMITYDDVTSAALKTQWVLDQNLGGVMFWEFSGDTSDPSTSLSLAIHDALNVGGS